MSLLEGETLAAVPEPEDKGTEYIVWKKIEGTQAENEIWEKVGSGIGGRDAVIKAVAGQIDGVYSASPARSWKPVRVAAKVEVTLSEL